MRKKKREGVIKREREGSRKGGKEKEKGDRGSDRFKEREGRE